MRCTLAVRRRSTSTRGGASLLLGGEGAIADLAQSGRFAASVFGESATGQYVAGKLDTLQAHPFLGARSYVVPPDMKVWPTIEAVPEVVAEPVAIEGGVGTAEAGTLARGNINANIVGGVPDGYAGHHLIGIVEANNYPVMQQAAELGYNINRGSNGIALPTTVDESVASGLPLHNGRHLGEYTDFVDSQLSRLQNRYDMGVISDDRLIGEVGNVEDTIRQALLNKQVRLQNADPHF